MNAGKAFNGVQHLLTIKILSKLEKKGNSLILYKPSHLTIVVLTQGEK